MHESFRMSERLFQFNLKKDVRRFNSNFEKFIKNQRNDEVKSILNSVSTNIPLSSIVDSYGTTLLHLAANYGNSELIKFLVDSGCDVNVRNIFGVTPLLKAFSFKHLRAMRALIDTNAYICTDDAECILENVVRNKDILPISILIAFMQKLKRCNKDLETMANFLAQVNCPVAIVVLVNDARLTQLMLKMPDYRLNFVDSLKALQYVMETVDIENLRVLYQSYKLIRPREELLFKIAGSIIESSVNWEHMKPVFMRLTDWIVFDQVSIMLLQRILESAERRELLVLLEQCNVDVQIIQKYKLDVLPILFSNHKLGTEDLMDILRRRRFDVNAESVNGFSALHFAALIESQSNIRLLLELSADCNVKDNNGLTPLYYVSSAKCFELLLQSGADLHIANVKYNMTLVEKVVRGSSFYEDSLKVVLAQLAIDHCQGVQINQKDLDAINRNQFKEYYENCLKQVKEMMSREIFPSLTLFGIITTKAKNMAHHVRSQETISTILEGCSQKSLNSYYCSSLKLNLEKAYNIYRAKCRAATIISKSTSIPINYDHLVIDRIFDFLSYKDMLEFSSA